MALVLLILVSISLRFNWKFNDSKLQLQQQQQQQHSTLRTKATTKRSDGNHNNNTNNTKRHRDMDSDVTWEWTRYHQQAPDGNVDNNSDDDDTDNGTAPINTTTVMNTTSSTPIITPSKNNLLISQYDSGTDVYYGTLLNLTRRVNQAYAKRYQFDYVILHGIAFRTKPFDHTLRKPTAASRSTYNKIILSQEAIVLQYDYVLILDSDAMMYDFTRDISTLVPDDKLLLAHQVMEEKWYWNINIGVIVFNLRHPMIHRVVFVWGSIVSYESCAGEE
jgi:hypothetical protein